MGKGDKKSRKGKISMGSYGNTRPKNSKSSMATKTEPGADPTKNTPA